MKKSTSKAKAIIEENLPPEVIEAIAANDDLPGVPDDPEMEEVKEEEEGSEKESPPYVIYVSYWWKMARGNRSGFGASSMRTHFPDISMKEHVEVVVAWLAKQNGYDELTLVFWKPLEG